MTHAGNDRQQRHAKGQLRRPGYRAQTGAPLGNVVSLTMSSVTTGRYPDPVVGCECSQGTQCCKNAACNFPPQVKRRKPDA